mmetsp:Transcript_11585/g.29200  ORF Transcript_11585/g.29200 Transcript_11585/m.29200 type:complete len:247 (+) Transcript_11585:136-876(+)
MFSCIIWERPLPSFVPTVYHPPASTRVVVFVEPMPLSIASCILAVNTTPFSLAAATQAADARLMLGRAVALAAWTRPRASVHHQDLALSCAVGESRSNDATSQEYHCCRESGSEVDVHVAAIGAAHFRMDKTVHLASGWEDSQGGHPTCRRKRWRHPEHHARFVIHCSKQKPTEEGQQYGTSHPHTHLKVSPTPPVGCCCGRVLDRRQPLRCLLHHLPGSWRAAGTDADSCQDGEREKRKPVVRAR